MDKLKSCPFCGASKDMLYQITKTEYNMPFDEYPCIFCDACKAIVYFEDSTSTGSKDDARILEEKLVEGWNARAS